MTPAQWERVQEVYHLVSELPADQQQSALNRECADDPLVREEVLELLRAESSDDLDAVVQRVAYDVASHADERVGPYRLERELGRGGMGTVYLATRDDREYERKVAIKFLNIGLDQPEYLRRFRQERQILADLEHPNIARMLEGGQTHSGQPYLVMEYVDGKPLLTYCQEAQASREQALELVAQICDAVQYAHSNLVVHRDLKPTNILVTAAGTPKLLDFGIAKVLATVPGQEQPVTQTGHMLTLDYASPEQIRGEPISTATDIYSLGVILYELIAGARPFAGSAAHPLIWDVLNANPVKPSLRARETGKPQVPRELDNVVLKAMAKEPARRYQSASALAEDLRRHLAGQPVLAHGESLLYVTSKFVGRHRVATGLAATLALAVVALAVQLSFTNQNLAAERDIAVRERANAREVSNFMVELFGNATRTAEDGDFLNAKEMLDRGARGLQGREVGDPVLRANLLAGLGAAYQRMGRWEEARVHLEECMRLLRGSSQDAADVRVEALTEYSNLLERTGELVQAEAIARELVQVARAHRPEALATALMTLGNALSHAMKQAEAEKAYREALALIPGGDGADIPARANLAIALLRQGKLQESQAAAVEVMELIKTHWGENSPAVAFPLDTLGNLEAARGNYTKALSTFEEVARIIRGPKNEESPNLAHAYCGMAETYLAMRDAESAKTPLEACAALRAGSVKPDSYDALTVLRLQGWRQLLLGDPGAAETLFRRVLSGHQAMFGDNHVTRAIDLRFVGMALAAKGDFAAAAQSFSEAAVLRKQLALAEDQEHALLLLEAGDAAMAQRRFVDAEESFRRAALVRKKIGASPALVESANVRLAESLAAQGNLPVARNLLDASLASYRVNPPEAKGENERAAALLETLNRSSARNADPPR